MTAPVLRRPFSLLRWHTKQYAQAATDGQRTCLYDFHVAHAGKIVPFAGWSMPVQYADQSLSDSHMHTRKHVSLFDVSHMLQTKIYGKDRVKFIESLVPGDIQALKTGQGTLSIFTNDKGGINDDLIVTNTGDDYLYMVTNAGCIEKDVRHLQDNLKACKSKGWDVSIEHDHGRGLVAVQGPEMTQLVQPETSVKLDELPFMTSTMATVCGIKDCRITRCGYTGEDGVEISVDPKRAAELCEKLLKSKNAKAKLAGLGPRDSLRLESGLCLYGNDMDETTTPVEASLTWLIAKRRRQAADFPGAAIILQQIKEKPSKRRVGLQSDRGRPPRSHANIVDENGKTIGQVTSGSPSPFLKKNIAMAYVPTAKSSDGTKLRVDVTGKGQLVDVEVTKMPFVPTKYFIKK